LLLDRCAYRTEFGDSFSKFMPTISTICLSDT
jgi:hypothetical protein